MQVLFSIGIIQGDGDAVREPVGPVESLQVFEVKSQTEPSTQLALAVVLASSFEL